MRHTSTYLLPLLLLSPLALTAQQTQPERVAGQVVSVKDGHPLPHARVSLTGTRDQKEAATTLADAQGRFRFDPVPPGKYRIAGSANGYLPAAYLSHGQYATAIVTGAGLATGSLILQLTPVASLTGHIRDDDGDPIPRAALTLYREAPTDPHRIVRFRNTQSSEEGDYEFTRLAPGRYYLAATATPWYAVHPPLEIPNGYVQYRASVDPALDVAYPTVFYPSALDSDGASPLVVTGGEQLIADLQLHAQHAFTVTLRGSPGDARSPREAQSGRSVQLTHLVFGQEEQLNVQSISSFNGVRQIDGIAPGRYTLEETTSSSGTLAQSDLPVSSLPLDLTSNSVTVDPARATDPATLTIALHMANGEPLPASFQFNLRSGHLNRAATGKPNDKGVIALKSIPPGDYSPVFFGVRNLSVLNVAVDGKPALDRRIHVAGGGNLQIDLTLSNSAVRLEGFARGDGKPAVGAMVVLVPAGADTGEPLFRRDQSDLDGSFVMNNVVPGNYILIAIDDGWPLRWTDIPTLAPYLLHGTPISVPATAGNAPLRLPDPVVTQPR